MIAQPAKPSHNVSSYRPISLLPMLYKLLEKLFIKRIQSIVDDKNLIPSHQFGCRANHSLIDQAHRITAIIEEAFERGEVCSAVFFDVSQAFDRVWLCYYQDRIATL